MKRYRLLHIITAILYLSSFAIAMDQSTKPQKKYVYGLGLMNGLFDTYNLASNVLYQVNKSVEDTKANKKSSFDIHHPDNQGRFAKVIKELINKEDEDNISTLFQGLNYLNRPVENSGRMQEAYDFALEQQKLHEKKVFESIKTQDDIFVDTVTKQIEKTKATIAAEVTILANLLKKRETELEEELEKNMKTINRSKNIRINTLELNKEVKEAITKKTTDNNEYNSDIDEDKPEQYDMQTILKRTNLNAIVSKRQYNIKELQLILQQELSHWEKLPIYKATQKDFSALSNSTHN